MRPCRETRQGPDLPARAARCRRTHRAGPPHGRPSSYRRCAQACARRLSVPATACRTKNATSYWHVRIPSPRTRCPGRSARRTRHRGGPEAQGRQHAAHLQLRRLPVAADDQGLREEVRRRHQALDVQRCRRGADEDRLQGTSSSTSTSPATTRWASWSRPICCARSPRLLHQLPQPLDELRQPVVRPRRALHDPLHDLLHGDRLADGHGLHATSPQYGQPLRRPLGHAVRRDNWPSSTTGTPRSGWCCCATASRLNTTNPRGPRSCRGPQLLDLRKTMNPKVTIADVHRHARPVSTVCARSGRATPSTCRTTCRRRSTRRPPLLVPARRHRGGRQRPRRPASRRAQTRSRRTTS